jgi:hypothetical protein
MSRSALALAFAAHVALAFFAAPVFAQDAGGESVAPALVGAPGVAQQIRERVIAQLGSFQAAQALQALRNGAGQIGLAGVPIVAGQAAVPSPGSTLNGDNPAAERSSLNRQALSLIPGRSEGGLLAGFSGGRALSRPARVADPEPATTFIDNSHNLVVNANGSPVAIGNNNVVRQQVSTSIATNTGGLAIANSATENGRRRGGTGQTASSSATSHGSSATATSSNNDVSPR